MNTNKKTFNYTILFFVLYGILAVAVLLWIWWPKDNRGVLSKASFYYEDIDEKQKALDIYTVKITSLLSENNLPLLYEKLNYDYKIQYNINENNYKSFLESANYISKNINIIESTINIQDNDVYVYRYKYTCNNKICYVNLIETMPYEYTLSFEQDTIPIVNNSSSEGNNNIQTNNTKITTIDNINYEVSKSTIRENGITYVLKITNNSDKTVEYNFDNITNVTAIMSDGKTANLGGAVISSDDDILSPNSYLEKELFFPVSSADQNKIKTIRIQNVKIGDKKSTVSVNV